MNTDIHRPSTLLVRTFGWAAHRNHFHSRVQSRRPTLQECIDCRRIESHFLGR